MFPDCVLSDIVVYIFPPTAYENSSASCQGAGLEIAGKKVISCPFDIQSIEAKLELSEDPPNNIYKIPH